MEVWKKTQTSVNEKLAELATTETQGVNIQVNIKGIKTLKIFVFFLTLLLDFIYSSELENDGNFHVNTTFKKNLNCLFLLAADGNCSMR
jgi:hypothetical protein